MGFGSKWVSWIKWCISTTTFSILVNGTPIGSFHRSRGLRQRDPLSPYPFVLGMEALSCLCSRVVEGDFLFGCKIDGRGGEGLVISHLLYVNGTLVLCELSQNQVTYLSWLLMWFEVILGLSINLHKSEIIPTGRVDCLQD